MLRRTAAVVAALALAAGLGAGCSRDKKKAAPSTTTSSTTTSTVATAGTGLQGVPGGSPPGTITAANCLPLPGPDAAKVPAPAEAPPFPSATRWTETTPQQGQTLYTAAVPGSLTDLQDRIRTEWLPAGWRELAGETEPGRELEGIFQRQGVRVGFRARVLYCEPGWLELRLAMNR